TLRASNRPLAMVHACFRASNRGSGPVETLVQPSRNGL
ncbi:mCG1026148, partial [Mus musculus]